VRADLRGLAALAVRGDQSRLVELKAFRGPWPMFGTLGVEPAGVTPADLGPEDVLVAPELAATLELELGDELELGGASFRVRGLVTDEPDRLEFRLALGPRVITTLDGLERTDLTSSQSRVSYAALFAFARDRSAAELKRITDDLRAALPDADYLRIQAHTEAQPSIRRSLDQVRDFLGLVALLSLLLGGIGVSQVVRAWLAGRVQAVAVLRALGLRAPEIAAVYLGNVALLALAGSAVGGLLGSGLPFVARALAPDLFEGPTSTLFQPLAALRGVGLGLFVALAFSLPPLTAVWRVSPASVLRGGAAPLAPPRLVRFGAPLLLLVGVLAAARAQGGSWLEALVFSGSLLGVTGLLWLGARGAAGGARRLPRGRFGPTLEHGLAALARPGAGITGAVVALGLGVMVVLSMALVQRGLDHTLRDALPEEAPSVFLVDVQPDQWEGVRTELEAVGARNVDSTPVVMARLRAVDGRQVSELAAERRDAGRAAWQFSREQRLTWTASLPPDNRIVEGALWSDPDRFELSVEQDFAADLGVTLGSNLLFDVQGVPIELAVTSIRTVEWESFGINFFLIAEPGALEGAPHFRLAVGRLDGESSELALQTSLARAYPNVTLLRLRPLLETLAGVLDRIASGVRALGGFTVLTGLVILAGAVATTALRRAREAALLRALGLTRAGVARLFAIEFALTGLIAGLFGAAGGALLSWAFLTQVTELAADIAVGALIPASLATALLATLAGLAASARALRVRPSETLRAN
jgi:putative ABC transport system permease protein